MDLPEKLIIHPMPDEEGTGFGPCSEYVELCWVSALGPTATLTYRRLGMRAILSPGSVVVTRDLAESLGARGVAANSKLGRALNRLEHFRVVARWDEVLLVRTFLRPFTPNMLERSPASVRSEHERLMLR